MLRYVIFSFLFCFAAMPLYSQDISEDREKMVSIPERTYRLVSAELDLYRHLYPPEDGPTFTKVEDILQRLEIQVPKFPEKFDLSEEFGWIQHLQHISVFACCKSGMEDVSKERLRYLFAKNDNLVTTLYKSYSRFKYESLQKLWEQKWDITVPDLMVLDKKFDKALFADAPESPLFDYVDPIDLFTIPEKSGVFLTEDPLWNEYHKSKEEQKKKLTCLPPCLSYPQMPTDKHRFPERMELLILSQVNTEGIYLVAAYHLLDKDVYRRYFFDPSKIRLRYVFMGYQPPILRGGMKRNFPPFMGIYDGDKKQFSIDDFSPTGIFVYIDDEGHPTHYYSAKNGKYFGAQIGWNKEGTIVKFEDIKEPAESCADVWLEFGTDAKFN